MMTDSFLDYLRFERNYSEKTIVSYGIDLTKFEEYFKGRDENIDFTTVDADLVRGWIMNLMEAGYTSTSVNRKLSSLRSFYRFLLKKGVVRVDPMLKIIGPKNKKPLPVFLKEREMDRLLDEGAKPPPSASWPPSSNGASFTASNPRRIPPRVHHNTWHEEHSPPHICLGY